MLKSKTLTRQIAKGKCYIFLIKLFIFIALCILYIFRINNIL